MAHEEYTGKSGGTTITVGGASIPTGWQQIVITEKGGPATEQIDITTAGDAGYSYMDDPLGSKGQPSCTIQVSGLLSVTDFNDSGVTSKTMDTTADVVVTKKTGEDTFTAASAVFRGFETEAPFAGKVPYTVTYALDSSAGAWT